MIATAAACFRSWKPVDGAGIGAMNRQSVTFIMGADRKAENKYYLNAAWFFSHDVKEKTDRVVLSCGSLAEVIEYVSTNAPAGEPWGRINIVSHGNPWTGLSAPVAAGGTRTTVETIDRAVALGTLKPPSDKAVDDATEIRFLGCGIGLNPGLREKLIEAFCSPHHEPKIEVSDKFHLFTAEQSGGRIVDCRMETAKPYFEFYPKGYRSTDTELIARLAKRYPSADIDWKSALERNGATRLSSGPVTRTFEIPIDWSVAYPNVDALPDLMRYRDQQAWLAEQKDLLFLIEDLGLDRNSFMWTFMKSEKRNEDGSVSPAIRAYGLCTVLAVLS